MLQKFIPFALKKASEGIFSGTASPYGNLDLQGDIVDAGAFTKSLEERGNTVPILWQHDQAQPIGLGTLTDGPQGLKIDGKLTLAVKKAEEAYALMGDDVISGLSIGYTTVKQKRDEKGNRHLQEVKIFEVSVVTFPANEDARVSAVKDAFPGLSLNQTAMVRALSSKDASLQDRIDEVYEALQEAYPLVYAYALEIYDTYCIVRAGDRFYSIDITWITEDGDIEATLGMATEVERVWIPVGMKFDTVELATKAGRMISSSNYEKLKSASDALGAAADHLKTVLDGASAVKDAHDADPLAEVKAAIRENIKAMQPASAA